VKLSNLEGYCWSVGVGGHVDRAGGRGVAGGWRILCSAVWFAASSASGNICRSLFRCVVSVAESARVAAISVYFSIASTALLSYSETTHHGCSCGGGGVFGVGVD
jgi:hypothetical protein